MPDLPLLLKARNPFDEVRVCSTAAERIVDFQADDVPCHLDDAVDARGIEAVERRHLHGDFADIDIPWHRVEQLPERGVSALVALLVSAMQVLAYLIRARCVDHATNASAISIVALACALARSSLRL